MGCVSYFQQYYVSKSEAFYLLLEMCSRRPGQNAGFRLITHCTMVFRKKFFAEDVMTYCTVEQVVRSHNF